MIRFSLNYLNGDFIIQKDCDSYTHIPKLIEATAAAVANAVATTTIDMKSLSKLLSLKLSYV